MTIDEIRGTMAVIGSILLLFGLLKTIEKHADDLRDWWGGWK